MGGDPAQLGESPSEVTFRHFLLSLIPHLNFSGLPATSREYLNSLSTLDFPASPDEVVISSRASSPAASSLAGKRCHSSSSSSLDTDCRSVSMSEDCDGFTTVKSKSSKKRSRRPGNASDSDLSDSERPASVVTAPRPATVNPPRPASANPPRPASVNPPRPATVRPPRPATSQPRSSADTDPPVVGRKVRPPPPLYLRNKANWNTFVTLCSQRGVGVTAFNTFNGIRVMTETSDSFRAAVSILTDNGMPYHTHTLEEDRKLRVVIRGVPKEFADEEIKADLANQNYPVHSVHRMYNRFKTPLDMVAVCLDLCPEGKAIYKSLHSILKISGLRVEAPHRRGAPMQCHKCQLYGHSQSNCFADAACVKCLGAHATRECTRNKETDGPPSCVLCRQAGHPANYRGCPRAPKTAKTKKPFSGPKFIPAPAPSVPAWRSRDFPSLPTPAPVAPPALVPRPNDPRAPANRVSMSAPLRAIPSAEPYNKHLNDNDYLAACIEEFSYQEEIALLTAKLRTASSREQRFALLQKHSAIVNKFKNL